MGPCVVITGANRGLGLAMARLYAKAGAELWSACRSPDDAVDLHALDPAGVLSLDVGEYASIDAFGVALKADVDSIDLLINNAGVNARTLGIDRADAGVFNAPPEPALEMIRINGLGAVLVTRALLPLLSSGRDAKIVNITSQLGSMVVGANFNEFRYAASKAVTNMFTVTAAAQLKDQGITVVCFHPGWVRTGMGGPQASLTPEESAEGIVAAVDGLTIEDSGRFLRWDGTDHPW